MEAHEMNVFTIEHMITKKERRVHATRLRFWELKKLRYNSTARRFKILTSWEGFEEIEDSWEPFTSLLQDIPVLIFKFLHDQHAKNQSEVEDVCRKHKKELRGAKTRKKIKSYLPI